MRNLAFILLLMSSLSFAAPQMKPGLWKIDMTSTDASGKKTDISKQMEAAMANVPADQRKKMQEMMKNMGQETTNVSPTKVCLTEQMVKDPKNISKYQQDKCKTDTVAQSNDKIISTFSCEDGTKGKINFVFKDSTSYTGKIDVIPSKGRPSSIEYHGKFLSSDCGNVKPVPQS